MRKTTRAVYNVNRAWMRLAKEIKRFRAVCTKNGSPLYSLTAGVTRARDKNWSVKTRYTKVCA